jgi:hypothetical protein
MLSPEDIRASCLKKYPAFLRAVVDGEAFFPLEIRFGRPSSTAAWSTLQSEISGLALAQTELGYRIDWTEINTRQWGRQRLPERVWFETEADYLRVIGKADEVRRFRVNVTLAREQCSPLTEGWLSSHVMRVIEHGDEWPRLLLVCRYFMEHPRPGLYARELPITVGTKFIDENRPILRSLLDYLLQPEAVDTEAEHFESRFRLRFEEAGVRMRLLDERLGERLGLNVPITDLSVPISQFSCLPWGNLKVLIVENKMTFLTLPPIAGTLAIWGGGNAADGLIKVPWLTDCRLFYWGDLDVHGFHILSRLRRALPRICSVMMDNAVLERFSTYRVKAGDARYEEVSGLSPPEQETYGRLLADQILLEQEKIPHVYAVEQLRHALA